MGLILDVLYYAIDSMFLGVICTIAGVALLFFLIKSFYPKSAFTPVSFIVGGILFLFLAFQSVLMCGAFKVKDLSEIIESRINSYIPAAWKVFGHEFDKEESQQICDNLGQDFPLFACYIGWADFSGHTPETIAVAMKEELNSFMNAFILRRVLWGLLFVVVGAVGVIKTMEIYQAANRRQKTYTAQRRDFRTKMRR